jgi:hypothetical protein
MTLILILSIPVIVSAVGAWIVKKESDLFKEWVERIS